MKKTITILAALCMAVVANAKILRVSNVEGSSAPYTTFEAAHDAASPGDTIMLDASNKVYGDEAGRATIMKSLVILGPGYWLVENGIVEEGAGTAEFRSLTIKADGTVVKGLCLSSANYIDASKVVINRCIIGSLSFTNTSNNAIITQNFIKEGLGTSGGTTSRSSYHQITNNIFTSTVTGSNYINSFTNCYFAYNTFRTEKFSIYNILNSTFEYNICNKFELGLNTSGNSIENNYATSLYTQATDDFIDKDYYASLEIPADVRATYGAFAGDAPYILSGVPAGPVVQDLIVPTTVEKGSKMSVTVKVGVVK